MNMSINKSGSQKYFEEMFTRVGSKPFRQIPKTQYEETCITKNQADEFKRHLESEVASYYYKALLSYIESLSALEDKLFSWATVRLYYSVFYSIRAFLACEDIAILRQERRLYYIRAKEGEHFKRCEDTTDHKGSILTLCKLFKNVDPLLSNAVEGMDAYHWMMKKREEVNYKDMDFHDPFPPDFLETIHYEVQARGIKSVIEKLINDNWLYCFQEEYAVLGIPTKRLVLTVDEIHRLGKTCYIADEKKQLIETMSNGLSEDSIRALEIWKR